MQIHCPNCDAVYQVDDKLAEEQTRRLKCSNCGNVFTVGQALEYTPKDAVENPFDALAAMMQETSQTDDSSPVSDQPAAEKDEISPTENAVTNTETTEDVSQEESIKTEAPDAQNAVEEGVNEEIANEEADEEVADEVENVDLEKIFERLSEHTEHLIEREKKLPLYEKMWLQIKNTLGFHFKIKWSYLFVGLAIFVLLSLYNNRYQIVREVPFLNGIYKFVGIRAKIPGEGLEFQNIGWDYVRDEEQGARLEIKGFVYNLSTKDIELPIIHIEILDKDTALLQSQNREVEEKNVEPGAKIPLSLVVANPAPTAKYVYLTFIDKD